MKKDYTHIILVVDVSGSMGPLVKETHSGILDLIKEQQKVAGKCTISILVFNDKTWYLVLNKDINLVTDVNVSASGWTALYDGIGRAVDDAGQWLSDMPEEEKPSQVIVTIITDGEENFSYKYGREKIKDLITQQTEKYNWNFTFIGANQDAILAANNIGISHRNAVNYSTSNTLDTYTILSNRMGAARSTMDPASLIWDEADKAKVL